MRIAILLLILAVLSGGLGLLVEGLQWAFVIALLLAVASAGVAARARRYGQRALARAGPVIISAAVAAPATAAIVIPGAGERLRGTQDPAAARSARDREGDGLPDGSGPVDANGVLMDRR